MTVLITAAAGRTSGFVIRALLDSKSVQPSDLRLFVRSSVSVEKVREQFPELSDSSFVLGDYLEVHTLGSALKGVDVVFHNAPTFHQHEAAMGISVIDAAKEASVKHFVYCSVLFPILTKLLNHAAKARVEEYLLESGLNYTILEPSSLMQNLQVERILSTSTVLAYYTPDVLQGFLDLGDLAEVATIVILNPSQHNRARYELVGQNCCIYDVARIISEQTGKRVEVERVARDELLQRGGTHFNPQGDFELEALDRMLYYYDKRGIPGNSNVLRWLLCRRPTTFADLVQRALKGTK